jgi:hypothetical protein
LLESKSASAVTHTHATDEATTGPAATVVEVEVLVVVELEEAPGLVVVAKPAVVGAFEVVVEPESAGLMTGVVDVTSGRPVVGPAIEVGASLAGAVEVAAGAASVVAGGELVATEVGLVDGAVDEPMVVVVSIVGSTTAVVVVSAVVVGTSLDDGGVMLARADAAINVTTMAMAPRP